MRLKDLEQIGWVWSLGGSFSSRPLFCFYPSPILVVPASLCPQVSSSSSSPTRLSSTRYGREALGVAFLLCLYIYIYVLQGGKSRQFLVALFGDWWEFPDSFIYIFWCFIYFINYGLST